MLFLEQDNTVINIKYKQMDKDPEIKKVINGMERFILGDRAVGLMEHLGLTPGRIQKNLDEQWETEFDELIEEHKTYIFEESRKRSFDMLQKWTNEMNNPNEKITKEELMKKMGEEQQKAEIQVIKELLDKHL
ncbi:hypothetical protein [Bacillus cereus]|uniref:hypothetical protein n=1 Tax=Bacillus cereus TaxID=1396 RepID=UPI0020D26ABB|nr:hypothetical protein [Bacillus cereus]